MPDTLMPTRRRLLALLTAGVALLPALPGQAQQLDALQTQIVQEVSGFFNSFRTLRGQFTQISPRGRVSTGVFVIARPGRMRFEYAPPHPLVIVSDGTWVAIRNNAKDKVEYYPLSKTPLKIVLAERVDLLRDALVEDVRQEDGLVLISLRGRDKSMPGKLLLVYDPERRMLQQWTVIDSQGRRTTVTIGALERDIRVSSNLFQVPRTGEGPRRRNVRQNFNVRRTQQAPQ